MYPSKVCIQEFWYIVSGLDIQLEQSQNEVLFAKKSVAGRDVVQPPVFVTAALKGK